jgi:hypothetical protein
LVDRACEVECVCESELEATVEDVVKVEETGAGAVEDADAGEVADEVVSEDVGKGIGKWLIEDRRAGQMIGSPADEDPAQNADIAYLARHVLDGQVVVHIAGIHAIGSLGAAHYLTSHLDALFSHPDLFTPTGEQPFSAVIRASFDGLTITHSGLIAGPYPW